MWRILVMIGGKLSLATLDRGLSLTLSEMLNMKEVTSVQVGPLRKRAWSLGLRMRRDGRMYEWFWRSGGEGSGGVAGGGAVGGSRWKEARCRCLTTKRERDMFMLVWVGGIAVVFGCPLLSGRRLRRGKWVLGRG